MKDNSIRQHRLESLILRSISDIFQREKDTLTGKGLVSITQVRLAPDLSVAKVYLSILPTEQRDAIFDMVNSQKKFVRKLLGAKIKNVRKIPDLIFFIDDSFDYAQNIEKLLQQ